jgi:hypothetical protein
VCSSDLPQVPVINSVVSTDPSDCGVIDGAITVTATGINLQYSMDGGTNWSNSGTFSGLASGTYNVAVRNNTGTCVIFNTTNPIILTAPNSPSITNVASTQPTDCNANDGTITITAQGGTGPLKYSIDNGTTWTTSGSFTTLSGGTYEIRVANTDITCIVTYPNVTLIDKVAPSITNVAKTNVTDCGLSDGTITITASSTQGSVEYSINGGTTWQPSNVFTGLSAAGNPYLIRVRNIDGTCMVSAVDVTITEPTAPAITNVVPTSPSDCGVNDGSIVITATAGSAVTEYSIDGGANWQNSGSFTGLTAGTYNVSVRNTGNTCVITYASNSVILSAPNAPSITNVTSTNPTDCMVTDGTITITSIGGSSVKYSINGGVNWQNSNSFASLAGGTYQIRARNGNGSCIVSYPNIVLIDKVQPVISNVASTDVTNCNIADGTIIITASSAQGAVEYAISGDLGPWSQSGTFTGLTAGTYQIRVRNIDGTCITTSPDVIIDGPVSPVIASVTPANPTNCGVSDGTINISATGTTGTLEYSIDGGNNWQASSSFVSLAPGTYNVSVRYVGGTCQVINTSNPIILTAPNAASITNVTSTNPTDCTVTDGTITITATGGLTPLEYSIGGVWQTSNVFSNLSGGVYPISVRNTDGSCTVIYPNVTLIDKIQPTITNVAQSNVTDCGVIDGTITITAASVQGAV